MIIDIIDLGSGNVKSIMNTLALLNLPTKCVVKPNQMTSNTLILPGVGSAGPYMDKMKASGFDQAVKNHAASGNNVIGVCLGYQLMTNFTEEDGGVEGLGLINGRTERLKINDQTCSHNGWDAFSFQKKMLTDKQYVTSKNLTRKQNISGRVFYNHEYGVVCEGSTSLMIGATNFNKYAAMTIMKNIIGMQFHPEKSQHTGLSLMAMLL